MVAKKEAAQVSVEYRGHKVIFNKSERWETTLKGAKKPTEHENLKRVQEAIDRSLRNDFERIPVFVEAKSEGYGYRSTRRYVKAVITSVGIDRDIFIQREGDKHSESFGSWSHDIFVQDDKNAGIIAELHSIKDEMEALDKKRRTLEEKMSTKAKTLKQVDTSKIIASVLGADEE